MVLSGRMFVLQCLVDLILFIPVLSLTITGIAPQLTKTSNTNVVLLLLVLMSLCSDAEPNPHDATIYPVRPVFHLD